MTLSPDQQLAVHMEQLLMSRRFGEAIVYLENALAQQEDSWQRYHLALARFLAGDAHAALLDMTNLVANNINDIHLQSGEDIATIGAWAAQMVKMAEIPVLTLGDEMMAMVELGLSVAQLAADLVKRPLPYLADMREVQQRLWLSQPPGTRCKRRYLRPSSPRLLQVEPTNHCNLDCVMCPRRIMTRPTGFMTMAIWQRLLETWRFRGGSHLLDNLALPGQSRFRIHFSGVIKLFFLGEPLLHKQLPQMVDLAHKMGCQVSIQTNGAMLDRPIMRQRLLDARPDAVGFSVDGVDAASYEAVRKKAKWSSLLTGMQALHEERAERGLEKSMVFNISTILADKSPQTQDKVDAFLAPLKALVEQVSVISLDTDWQPDYIAGEDNQVVTYQRNQKGAPNPCTLRCAEPANKMNVLWDGLITPCCTDYDGVVRLGHVEDEGGIDGVWNGERVLALQKAFFDHNLDKHDFCRACLG
ncbi:MAG: radical SAM protein [Magnetococcales bacterium]|nr:radical SAM protein [Magnetococcales bacterium]NGZ27185.1 radical SAM protein [Magnetococcales bacterium]